MSQKCNVTIIINNISDGAAKTVKKSLEPDNVNFPDGLYLKVEKIDNKLVFNFSSSGNMGKLISTIDEILNTKDLDKVVKFISKLNIIKRDKITKTSKEMLNIYLKIQSSIENNSKLDKF